MKCLFLFLTFLPTIYEAFTDRHGETRKDKLIDTAIVVGYTVLLTGVAYLVLANWIAVPLLVLMCRVTTFDYITNAFLKRFSEGHFHINIWKFTGTTTWFWDQWIAKIDWRVRVVVRLVILSLSVVLFLLFERS